MLAIRSVHSLAGIRSVGSTRGNLMQSAPRLLPMAKESETFAGITYHIDGELVPMLTVDVVPDKTVFFEHHILLWKHPSVEIRLRPMKGALKRMIAGMQVFVTEAAGSGKNRLLPR